MHTGIAITARGFEFGYWTVYIYIAWTVNGLDWVGGHMADFVGLQLWEAGVRLCTLSKRARDVLKSCLLGRNMNDTGQKYIKRISIT